MAEKSLLRGIFVAVVCTLCLVSAHNYSFGDMALADELKRQKPKHAFKVVERKMLNRALVLSVTTSKPLHELSQDDMREIAAYLVEQNSGHYMVRVFFYNPGEQPGNGYALTRFEWTKEQGLKMSYDRSRKPKKDLDSKLETPKYVILDSVTTIGGKFYADVLISSFSRQTPVSERRKAAKRIAKKEGFHHVSFYSTREAYKANMSASYLREHPDALEKGFLGSLENGRFSPGEETYP